MSFLILFNYILLLSTSAVHHHHLK